MNIGVVGLGRMGLIVAERLVKGGHSVFGFDPSEAARTHAQEIGATAVESLEALHEHANIYWLMVPAGDAVDTVLSELKPYLQQGDIVIDGGNSFFKNSVRRHNELAKDGIHYLDCGTSGGVAGRKIGFSLMVGGEKEIYEQVEPIFKAIAAPNGYGYMGPSGAGHYVKMTHNGIEYALLQAYAEGLHLLKEGEYKDLDFKNITSVWNNGSVIRSFIVELLHGIFTHDQELADISGEIGENKTGRWTMDEAEKYNVPMDLLERALAIRRESRETGGNYGTKVVAMLRNAFGGHEVKKK